MKQIRFSRSICPALVAWVLVQSPDTAQACATCFGASDSPLAQGFNWGILSLLALILMVLGTFVAFFIFLARRAAATPLPTDPATLEVHPEKA